VPAATSECLGTIAVRVSCSEDLANFTWLPLWLASENPAALSLRMTSRKGRGFTRRPRPRPCGCAARRWRRAASDATLVRRASSLALPLPSTLAKPRQPRRTARPIPRAAITLFSVLRSHVNLDALRDEPLAFLPHTRIKIPFHRLAPFTTGLLPEFTTFDSSPLTTFYQRGLSRASTR
jgi:hypothetical protein